eukprot:TRINITY_DN7665_c0_g1_i1.p3 TRINITY_DN7665_c0_g1~~TRINITY_DN7665_c0_g1_i1.p3  ORF type:complete len:115 (+),score=4.36 TRINITY_DN7665_c0_g1_i1:1117-1461(+)
MKAIVQKQNFSLYQVTVEKLLRVIRPDKVNFVLSVTDKTKLGQSCISVFQQPAVQAMGFSPSGELPVLRTFAKVPRSLDNSLTRHTSALMQLTYPPCWRPIASIACTLSTTLPT